MLKAIRKGYSTQILAIEKSTPFNIGDAIRDMLITYRIGDMDGSIRSELIMRNSIGWRYDCSSLMYSVKEVIQIADLYLLGE